MIGHLTEVSLPYTEREKVHWTSLFVAPSRRQVLIDQGSQDFEPNFFQVNLSNIAIFIPE